jgi:hypothetical protein
MGRTNDKTDLLILAHSHRENVARRGTPGHTAQLSPIDSDAADSRFFPGTGVSVTRVDLLEIAILTAVCVVAQFTNFSAKQGRALLCGDSVQYVAAAEALLDPTQTPHFEMRKPGYALLLAGVKLATDSMAWAAVAANHLFLALLPICAYLFGRHLHGRLLGWSAAILTIARLDAVVWGNRMLSEALFTCLFSFGLLTFAVAISNRRPARWALAAGSLLGLAWLTRGSATPVILVAGVLLVVLLFTDVRRHSAALAAFCVPIVACAAFECSLNHTYAGRFRPSNSTAGATILLRARHFEGAAWPHLPEVAQVVTFLPERHREDAYIGDYLDVWVARHRAIHENGMNEWDYDDLMGKVGRAALLNSWSSYWRSGLRMSAMHMLRRHDGQALSPVEPTRRTPPIKPAGLPRHIDWDSTWFAFYATPHLSADESQSLYHRTTEAALVKAPFGDGEAWNALRYWKTKPIAQQTLEILSRTALIWPGFGLLLCLMWGRRRLTCALFAAAYMIDSVFIGFLTPTNERLQFIWVVVDTAFAAMLPVTVLVLAGLLARRAFRWMGHSTFRRPVARPATQA